MQTNESTQATLATARAIIVTERAVPGTTESLCQELAESYIALHEENRKIKEERDFKHEAQMESIAFERDEIELKHIQAKAENEKMRTTLNDIAINKHKLECIKKSTCPSYCHMDWATDILSQLQK